MTRTEAAARRRQIGNLRQDAAANFACARRAISGIRQQRARGTGYMNREPVYPEVQQVAAAREFNRRGIAARRELAAMMAGAR